MQIDRDERMAIADDQIALYFLFDSRHSFNAI